MNIWLPEKQKWKNCLNVLDREAEFDVQTVSGWVMELFECIPKAGDFHTDEEFKLEIEVTEMSGKRIEQVRIRDLREPEEEEKNKSEYVFWYKNWGLEPQFLIPRKLCEQQLSGKHSRVKAVKRLLINVLILHEVKTDGIFPVVRGNKTVFLKVIVKEVAAQLIKCCIAEGFG